MTTRKLTVHILLSIGCISIMFWSMISSINRETIIKYTFYKVKVDDWSKTKVGKQKDYLESIYNSRK